MLDPSGQAVDTELLTMHEIIKWEGESSKKTTSLCTMLWYDERSFSQRNQLVSHLFDEILVEEAVDQVSSVARASVLTSTERLSLPMGSQG